MGANARQSPYLSGAVLESMVGLVICRAPDRTNLATVSFASEVAHHPTSLWISIGRGSFTHELLSQSPTFSFAVLHAGQADLAWRCGTVSGRGCDKSVGLPLQAHGEGFLFLTSSLSNLACRVSQAVEVGDHTLFIANILSGEVNSRHRYRPHLLLRDL